MLCLLGALTTLRNVYVLCLNTSCVAQQETGSNFYNLKFAKFYFFFNSSGRGRGEGGFYQRSFDEGEVGFGRGVREMHRSQSWEER